MRTPRDDRPEWIVQLELQAVAVVTVRAVDEAEAWSSAEANVRPCDVTEIREAEATIISGPHTPLADVVRRRRARRAQELQEASGRGR